MLLKYIREYPIWSFLIINYMISWSFLYPCYQLILENEEITPLALIGIIGAYGPSIAAVIIHWVIDKSTVKSLLMKVLKFRISIKDLAVIVLIPIALYIVCLGLAIYMIGGEGSFDPIKALSGIFSWFILALPFGPMGEELGWRGYMLPKLLKSYGVIRSTVLVGLAWGVWHLASFTFPGAAIPSFLETNIWTIGLFILNTISLSFLFTYIHLRSNGSVFYAILLHAFFNAAANVATDLLGEDQNFNIQLMAYCLNFFLAALIGLMMIRSCNS